MCRGSPTSGRTMKGTGKGSASSSASVHDGSSDADWVLTSPADVGDVDMTAEGAQRDAEAFSKKKGKQYPCAECQELYGHKEMILSRRAKHATHREAAPDHVDSNDVGAPRVVYLKICVECEAKERVKEGSKESTEISDIKQEVHRKNKGEHWQARGKYYKQACEQVDAMSGLSTSESKKHKTALSKKMADDFINVLKTDGIWEWFSAAGTKMKEAMKINNKMEELFTEWEAASSKEEKDRLNAALEAAEKKWMSCMSMRSSKTRGTCSGSTSGRRTTTTASVRTSPASTPARAVARTSFPSSG